MPFLQLTASLTFASGAGLAVSSTISHPIYQPLLLPAHPASNLVPLAHYWPRVVLEAAPRIYPLAPLHALVSA